MRHRKSLAAGALVFVAALATFAAAGRQKQAAAPAPTPPKPDVVAVVASAPAPEKLVEAVAPMPDLSHMPPRRVPVELAGSY